MSTVHKEEPRVSTRELDCGLATYFAQLISGKHPGGYVTMKELGRHLNGRPAASRHFLGHLPGSDRGPMSQEEIDEIMKMPQRRGAAVAKAIFGLITQDPPTGQSSDSSHVGADKGRCDRLLMLAMRMDYVGFHTSSKDPPPFGPYGRTVNRAQTQPEPNRSVSEAKLTAKVHTEIAQAKATEHTYSRAKRKYDTSYGWEIVTQFAFEPDLGFSAALFDQ
jgi:hypothetical protein